MSTRATYKFETESASKFFYIHHDGYPSGAAHYFKAMLDVWSRNPAVPYWECFTQANDRAESTRSHQHHGDTDYRYDLRMEADGIHVIGYARRDWAQASWERSQFSTFFGGTILEFIEKYRSKE